MNNRLRLLVIAVGAFAVVLVMTFPLWRPLFINTVVNEGFPGLSTDQQAAFERLGPTRQSAFQDLIPTDATMAVAMAKAAMSQDEAVPTDEQAMPQMTDPQSVATGSFIQIDVIHGASGKVTIYQLPDNSRVLRFEDFHATNGPDLHVILTKNSDPRTPADVGEDYVELGPLKGNVGNQNYNVPSEVDLSLYKGVVIYSEPFHVVFSTATLKPS
jgi:electron transfer DM13